MCFEMKQVRVKGGFTLLELTVVVAIIVALAAVVIPMVGQARRDGQVAEVLQVVDSLRTGVHRFHADTGRCPVELSSSSDPANHHLSLDQTDIPGWNGPYVDHVITTGDNPFGGAVEVHDDLDASVRNGFNILGGGSKTSTGTGSFVRFGTFPRDLARRVDDALDEGISGNWQHTGRVIWRNDVMDVFLLDLDGK